jgi:hypothetical protein
MEAISMNRIGKAISLLTLLSCFAVSAVAGENGLEGSWRVRVTVRNCQTGAPIFSFPALGSFQRGGTVMTSDGSASGALRSAGHGVWRHTTGHSYATVVEAFFYGPTGAMTGTQRLTQTIELETPDTFSAVVSAQTLDLNRNVIGSACATSVGTRLE